ncbi:hypothetical protein [Micromonospora sp. NPDC005710]|uniref:hypothetical protein n=1 Tax=Micromonospora sp. NPDC005710 TaxID=3157051 RepID=UPI0033D9EDA0
MVSDPHAALRGLLAGALLVAVRRRFIAGQDRAPVIRFVASARERYDATGSDVDPVLAEALVWEALGERPPVPHDMAAIVARTVLLLGLLEDEGLTDRELDEILVAAADNTTHGGDRHRVGASVESDRE